MGIFYDSKAKNNDNKTYEIIDNDAKSIVNNHHTFLKSKFGDKIELINDLPFLYWIPKMHKKPYSKQRYIAASFSCSTKSLSAVLTKCLKLIENQAFL